MWLSQRLVTCLGRDWRGRRAGRRGAGEGRSEIVRRGRRSEHERHLTDRERKGEGETYAGEGGWINIA